MQWLADMAATEAPDLVIANAGVNINTGPLQQGEAWDDMHRLFDVNVKAVMATVQASLPAMRARRAGQIALVSSLAAWRGRSEEHTSELQSLMRISYAVFCLKKKKRHHTHHHNSIIIS